MSERYPHQRLIHPALVFRRHPFLPLLNRLSPNIYGAPSPLHTEEARYALPHVDEVVAEYCQTGVPFIIVNLGFPKAGKTTLAGEEAAHAANRLHAHLIRSGRTVDQLSHVLTYIGYESVQAEAERTGKVLPGHGPGNQTREDHQISSALMEQAVRNSLENGQNVILEAPFFAGRGELGTIQDLATHMGIFAGLSYNARFIWPISDSVHEIFTMMMRTEYFHARTDTTLRRFQVRIHPAGGKDVRIPGADEIVLRRNFYPDLVRHLAQLYQVFIDAGHPQIKKFEFLFTGNNQLPTHAMHNFVTAIAPLLMQVLDVAPQDCIVGTNSILPFDTPAVYYTGLLHYLDKFRRTILDKQD